jgi:hypothetical protein
MLPRTPENRIGHKEGAICVAWITLADKELSGFSSRLATNAPKTVLILI